MDLCEKLAQIEGFVAENYVERSDHEVHLLTELISKNSYMDLMNSDNHFKRLHQDLEEVYKCSFNAGFRIEPDSFGGYCLINRSGKTIKCGEINVAVGLLAKKPKDREIDDWSLMEGDKLLVGVARWANHSCVPNCDYYMCGGYKGRECVRLRALKEIKDGEELTTFYNVDFFGEKNKFCLCEHRSKHGSEELQEESDEPIKPPKRKRNVKPRIKITASDVRGSLLTDLIKFYNEDSNVSLASEVSSIPFTNSDFPDNSISDAEQIEKDGNCSDFSDGFSSTEISYPCDQIETLVGVDLFANFSATESDSENEEKDDNDQTVLLTEVSGASTENLKASLLAIVSVHNGSDSLLNDLLKRDQLLFGGQTISPWAVKKQFEDFCSLYQSSKQSLNNGELILLNFRPLLIDIVKNTLPEMLKYAEEKDSSRDILMPTFCITEQRRINVRLIVNTDGANVCKTPITSAWPLFLAVADLSPKLRQLFKNLVLGALFVGSGYPDFDIVFEHIKRELSVTEKIIFNGVDLLVTFEPILLVADLIAKSKVLKMKQCNGFYGCTLCNQRGIHVAGSHRYPHDESFQMRSFDAHMKNIQELERGSVDELRVELGRKADCEIKTLGVKGKSKAFDLISNQPLSSPIDPMHQLFLGVAKDILLHHYERMRPEHKTEINIFIESLDLPKEFKNSLRKLDSLSNFKAKEVKIMLLYLSPIIFPPFLYGEERKSDESDLKKLVFSIRELFESSDNADLCDQLLNEFCLSMADKTNKMESINFHLLRHLGWQAKNIGPLFTTSAAMFESANRLLIAPLTGTVNQCQLMVWRFVRAKMIAKMSIKDDCLTEMLTSFHEKRKLDESYGFVESAETRKFRQERPNLKLFCRNLDFCFLSSAAYGRGCTADKYVAALIDGEMIAGEILFFFRGIANNCVLRKFKIVRKLTLIKSQALNVVTFGFIVQDTEEKIQISLSAIKHKLFYFQFKEVSYLIAMLCHYEHN